jgi:hexosaminidase
MPWRRWRLIPSLSCSGGPFEVPTTWGVFKEIYCAGNDSVFVFLKDVLDEVLELFPSEYIHIGGDEAPKYRWDNCDKCRSRMAHHGLRDGYALQSWFIGEMAAFLKSRGRTLVGWDEIREGGLPQGVIVQSWQGFEGATEAALAGSRAIVSPTSHAYFDYPVHKLTLEQVYSFNPIPSDLDPSLHLYIIGGACNMWTERAPQDVVDQRVFPRLLAMAEVLWSAPAVRNFDAFRQRARQHYPLLAAKGVNYGLEAGGVTIIATPSENHITVSLVPEQDNITIRFSTGSNPEHLSEIYTTPFEITDSLTLHTAAYIDGQRVSEVYTRKFFRHQGVALPYTFSIAPGGTYNRHPETTLTDGIRGTLDFHDGLWLGFWEEDVEIDFRLPKGKAVSTIVLGFMQSNPSWIFLPHYVEVTIKPRGLFKKRIRMKRTPETPTETLYALEELVFHFDEPISAKRINIKIKNPGKCPTNHPAAGSPTWLFIDEVLILDATH